MGTVLVFKLLLEEIPFTLIGFIGILLDTLVDICVLFGLLSPFIFLTSFTLSFLLTFDIVFLTVVTLFFLIGADIELLDWPLGFTELFTWLT